jgi:hypothetical protein
MKANRPRIVETISDFDRAAELLQVAEEMPPAKKVKLAPYVDVIKTLRCKEYSYEDVADFLTNQLGRKVSRSQVFGFVKRNPAIFEAKTIAALLEKPGAPRDK